MSNTFVTPRVVTTISQSRIDYNESVTSLLQNFASAGEPDPLDISLEGSTGLRTGMFWYKSGTDTTDGQGRFLVYDGTSFTRNGIGTYQMTSGTEANTAATAGVIEYGDLILLGTDELFMVNSAGSAIKKIGGDASTLSGLVSTQFLRSDESDSMTGSLTVSGDLTVDTNTLYVNSTTNRVGIGTTSPSYELDVHGTTDPSIRVYASGTASTDDSFLRLQIAGTSAKTSVLFGDSGSASVGQVLYDHSTDALSLWTSGTQKVTTTSAGDVGIGTTSPSEKLHVVGNVLVTGDVDSQSDEALKENIATLEDSLDSVKKLRGVSYSWKESGKQSIGLIAQEVEQVLPKLVSEQDGLKSVKYGNIVAVLVEAIKELSAKVEELESKLDV